MKTLPNPSNNSVNRRRAILREGGKWLITFVVGVAVVVVGAYLVLLLGIG